MCVEGRRSDGARLDAADFRGGRYIEMCVCMVMTGDLLCVRSLRVCRGAMG